MLHSMIGKADSFCGPPDGTLLNQKPNTSPPHHRKLITDD